MRRVTAAIASVGVLVLLSATFAVAQARPNFSGTWTLASSSAPVSPTGQRSTGPYPFGGSFIVKQDAITMTISRAEGDQAVTESFRLDGSETKIRPPGRGSSPVEVVANARWEGDQLVIVLELTLPNRISEQRRVLSMQDDDLIVESTGPAGTATRFVYNKS